MSKMILTKILTLEDIEQFDEISNLCDGSDSEIQIDEFENLEIDITKYFISKGR